MSKSTKSTANATATKSTANATKSNATKSNTVFDSTTVNAIYVKCGANCTHNVREYASLDNGHNNTIVFSPNFKKSKYNIFCTESVYTALSTVTNYENTDFIGKVNTASRTIPYTIECRSNNDFETMVKTLITNNMVRLLPTTK